MVTERGHVAPRTVDGPWVAIFALPVVALTVPAAVVLSGPLQSNGWPARLLVFWIAGAILLGWVVQRRSVPGWSPPEVGCWILVAGLAASLAATGLRTLNDVEVAGALRVALVMFPLAVLALGIALTANRRRSDLLLIGLVVGASVSALMAIVQFVTPLDVAQLMRLPGTVVRDVGGMGTRGTFERVKGSATHPIEFAVISGAIVPVALHFGRYGATKLTRWLGFGAAAALLVSIPMSVSRSGVLAVLVALLAYAVVLSTRQRVAALVIGLAALALFRAAVPGLLGTVTGVFTNASTDTSVTARTEDYSVIAVFFAESPVLGRGLGTFLPEEYFFLDNQYLLSLVEGGLVLVVTVLVFFVLVLAGARGAVLRAGSAADASRAQAVFSAVLAIAVSGAFFDLFSFAQATVALFVLAGVTGALWRDSVAKGRGLPRPLERIRGGAEAMPGRSLAGPASRSRAGDR